MYYNVNNWCLEVGRISIVGVSSSSLFLIGDSNHIQLSSSYDTPPESYIVGSEFTTPVEGISEYPND
ncbi:spore gernimation protein GerPD [Gracilibacillus oryzae]|uniref:Spore gernimation protein GerPD n=1 Tax=Gracilibacillus oryzae TaxID=1672701 RepID=A0A7C8KT27_9BACI|nr:spore gernimation protein GerPD [Gracilibacillus oryzae]KAB8139190.1 spore gernimation protein GerPD [Gracilibacillus oryzae]